MADDLRMALQDLLRKSELGDPAFLREGVRVLAQELMELEVSQHLGAERYERGSVMLNKASIMHSARKGRALRAPDETRRARVLIIIIASIYPVLS